VLAVITNSLCWGFDGAGGDQCKAENGGQKTGHMHLQISGGRFLKLSVAGALPFEVELHLPAHFDEMYEGRWVHLSVSHDIVKKDVKLYVNGEHVDTRYFQKTQKVALSVAHIGDWPGSDRGINGCMRELRFWSRVLTTEEIKASMHCTANTTDAGLIAAYPLRTDLGDISKGEFSAAGSPAFAAPMDLWHDVQTMGAVSSMATGTIECSDQWEEWTSCSKSCGGGFQVQEAHILSPSETGTYQQSISCPPMKLRNCNELKCEVVKARIEQSEDKSSVVVFAAICGVVLTLVFLMSCFYRRKATTLAKELEDTHDLQFEMSNVNGRQRSDAHGMADTHSMAGPKASGSGFAKLGMGDDVHGYEDEEEAGF
jgi:hypothetical protein